MATTRTGRFEKVQDITPKQDIGTWKEGETETALICSFSPDYYPIKDKEGKVIEVREEKDERLMVCRSTIHFAKDCGYLVMKNVEELREKFHTTM